MFYFKCFALYHQFYLSAADLDRYNAAADAEARDAVLIAVAKHLPVQCRTSTGCKLRLLPFVDCIQMCRQIVLLWFASRKGHLCPQYIISHSFQLSTDQ